MTSIVEHVVVTCLGWKQPKNFLRTGYFWPTIFKDCVEVVKKCHPCQIFTKKMHAHPAPMFPVIIVGPFTKWGVDFMTCHWTSARGHHYIIVVIDYFTKWVEAMPTFSNDGETTTLFIFNQVIARFGVPREIVTDHGSHFQNHMMSELVSKLGFRKEHLSPYYPQDNGQVEAINKSLKTILRRTINSTRMNWHLMLYPTLWAYQNLSQNFHWLLTIPTRSWSGSSFSY
jgi:transposase InsO family protein